MALAQERGALTAVASVEAPDVRIETPEDGPVTVVIEEGGVRVDLAFPDHLSVARFGRRVRAVCAPDEPVRRPRS
jgi:hypothetical protein